MDQPLGSGGTLVGEGEEGNNVGEGELRGLVEMFKEDRGRGREQERGRTVDLKVTVKMGEEGGPMEGSESLGQG